MADDLDPLPDDLRRAFDAERRRPGVDDAMRARLLGKVLGSVAVGAAIGTAAGTASAAAGAGAGAGAAVGAGTGAATGGTAGAAGGVAFAKMAPWLLGAFLIGGGVGAALHAAMTSAPAVAPPSSMIPSPPPSSRPEPGPNAAPSDSVAGVAVSALPPASVRVPPTPTTATIAPSTRPSSTATTSSSDTIAQRDVDLAAERALVDRARTALTRGQPAAALEALDSHAKTFPRGRLTEEREALAIDALARAGRTQEAATRADRFRATWPNSVFGGLVDNASPER